MRNNFAAMFEFHISKIQLFLYKLCPFVATLNHICLVNHVIVVECCKYTNLTCNKKNSSIHFILSCMKLFKKRVDVKKKKN